MSQVIRIDPVTRIEGNATINIYLNPSGEVDNAEIQVNQFRGFEKFIEGRPFSEMPALTARICGICSVSHSLASAKACDQILSVRIPQTAKKLRQIANLAQIIQSHAFNFFYLSAPDLLMGMDAPAEKRNIFEIMRRYPEIASDGVRLRKFGQQIIEKLAGKRIHPDWIVPGGVSSALDEALRDDILVELPAIMTIIRKTLDWFKADFEKYKEYIRTFGNFPSLFLGLTGADGGLEHYHGKMRLVSARGGIISDQLDPQDYERILAEAVESDSYLKSPYYKPYGYPVGMYRVGPLARMNIASQCGTPLADQELAEFHCLDLGAVLSSFHYHYARLIEILYAIEKIGNLLEAPDILDKNVRSFAGVNHTEGIGICEAPRGILIHHYQVDENGLITRANLLVASGHNNLAMNKGVLQVAKNNIHQGNVSEGILNRIEALLRAFDPCLACSTHASRQVSLRVNLYTVEGILLQEIER